MVKFQVGKIYKASNYFERNVLQKVIARSDRFLITKTIQGSGVIEWDKECAHLITVVNGVEVCMNAFYQQVLSADKKAEIQEDENKEEIVSDDWIIGKEYEAICLDTKQRFKVKLAEIHEDDLYPLTFKSNIPSLVFADDFDNYGDIIYASDCGNAGKNTVIVFKHGIKSILDWEEVKEERKPVCFEVGKEYKACSRDSDIWELKAVFDGNNRKIGVFYNKKMDANITPTIKTLNSVEYTTYGNMPMLDFIADEKYAHKIKALL